jgi:hypothetical protein
MNRNNLYKVFIIAVSVIVILLLLSVIPEFRIGNFTFKRINILSDILKNSKTGKPDFPVIKPQYIDTCKKGMVCFEDFSPGKTSLDTFFCALARIKKNKEIVRIAYFGDSFIEGDVMLEDLRDTLQKVYGGRGVGYVPITSMVAGFRETIVHSFANFKTYSVTDKSFSSVPIGFSGMTFVPQSDNFVTYRPAVRRRFLNFFYDIRLFYGKCDDTKFNYSLNGTGSKQAVLAGNKDVNVFSIPGDSIRSVNFRFPADKDLKLYGTSFEGGPGIYIDNYSVRGNSGYGLLRTHENIFSRFDSIQKYKLVVLHFGLNVVSRGCKNYDWYKKMMDKVIAHVKKCFPHTSILLVSVSDRSTKMNGEYTTMPEVPLLLETQRGLASENKIAFWNLYDAMGGENSMVKYVENKPPLANRDYTHLNFKGARKVAYIFAQTILYEQFKYEKKKSCR